MVDSASVSSRTVHVADAKTGPLWKPSEWRKIIQGFTRQGYVLSPDPCVYAVALGLGLALGEKKSLNHLTPTSRTLLKVHDTSPPKHPSSSSTTSKSISFSCVTFGPEVPHHQNPDKTQAFLGSNKAKTPFSYAFPMVAADQRGHVFAFDFQRNRFWLVARIGVSVTCITFSPLRKREIIVGLSDHSLQCWNIDSCQLVAKLPAFHHEEPHHLAAHSLKPLVISTCKSEALIWDSEEWVRKRLLTGNNCGVQQSSFSPDGVSIITAFEDGSLYVWFLDTFTLNWKLSLEQLAGTVPKEMEEERERLLGLTRKSYFATSSDDEVIAYSGLSSTLYVWNVQEKRLLHEILIPGFQNQWIHQIQFVGKSKIVGLLSNKGTLIFVDVVEAKFIGQLQGKHTFHSYALTGDGYTLATILASSKQTVSLVGLDPVLGLQTVETEPVGESADQEVQEHDEEQELAKMKRVTVTVENPTTFYELIDSKKDSKVLNRSKLRSFLNYYGVYPEKHRTLIWRYLLRLPENREPYEALLNQGLHPALKNFRQKFPLKSDKLAKTMEKVMSALAHWSPLFETLDYLPAVIFPFVKLFQNDLFSCLEVCMTIITNWCQKWWDYYPNPPIECLDILEELLAFHDPELLAHFMKHQVTSQIYGWVPMHTLCSELLLMEDWLRVWDHMVSNPPSFFYYVLIAYARYFRVALLTTDKHDDFRFFFQRRNPINVSKLLVDAYEIQGSTPPSVSPSSFLQPFEPLLRGQYPVFNKYPEFIINYQSKMKDRIKQDEEEYLRKRQAATSMTKAAKSLDPNYRSNPGQNEWTANETMPSWWNKMSGEDSYLNDRRSRIEQLEKDAKPQMIANASKFGDAKGTKGSQEIYRGLDHEWARRKDELISSRKSLESLDKERNERFKKNGSGEFGESRQNMERTEQVQPLPLSPGKSGQRVAFA